MIQQKHSYTDYGDAYPNSRKLYVTGSRSDIKVPMREIRLSDTKRVDDSIDENEPIRVYDTSGPATDPAVELDLESGLPHLRKAWIDERNDTEWISERGYQAGDDGVGQDAKRIPFGPADKQVRCARNLSLIHI